MKVIKEKLDYKIINIILYLIFFAIIVYLLKSFGIIQKIAEVLISLLPVIIGFIICFIAEPFVVKIRKLGLSKNVSAFLTIFLIFGLIIFIMLMVVPMFISEFSNFMDEVPRLYNKIVNYINPIITQKLHIQNGLKYFQDIFSNEMKKSLMKNVLDYSISTVKGIVNLVITIGTTMIVSFFIIKDIDGLKERIFFFISKNSKESKRYNMLMDIDKMLTAYVKGNLIDSMIVGMLVVVVCMILNIKYGIIFGFLTFLLNLIPYIGAIISEVIVSLYALITSGPMLAVIAFISCVSVQIIDANFLQPNIIAKSVNLHPVTVMSGLIVFNLIFGIFGMVIALPVLATIKIILEYKFNIQFDDVIASK